MEFNRTLLLQYLSAGGTLPENGGMPLNEAALLQTLEFYEQAVQTDQIDPQIVSYTSSMDYQSRLNDESLDAGVVSLATFSRLRPNGASLEVASIPLASDTPSTFLSGWMWVLVAPDTQQQVSAARFINWVMDVHRQGEYAAAIGRLGSQAEARRLYPLDGVNPALAEILLSNALTPPEAGAGLTTMRAIQTAFISVVNGELSAEAATRRAAQQLAG